jgi:hypothetical protein
VLSNIVDNAIDASPTGITIEARSERDWLSIVTTDDGPGFAAQVIDQIGKPYVSTKGRDGGGLGLFLVVNVARKLGGRLKVENRDDGGAQVTLTIPLSALAFQGKGRNERSGTPSPESSISPSLVIVEDDPALDAPSNAPSNGAAMRCSTPPAPKSWKPCSARTASITPLSI